MPAYALSPFSGEFRDSRTEAAFRSERLGATLRQAQLVFGISIVVHALLLTSDLRFSDAPSFGWVALVRLSAIIGSIACLAWVGFDRGAHRVTLALAAWQIMTAGLVCVLVALRQDTAQLSVFVLPVFFYLVVPAGFRHLVAAGIGCSVAMLVGYLLRGAGPIAAFTTPAGVLVALVGFNVALIALTATANRLRRLEWAATRRERLSNQMLAESRAVFEELFRTVPIPLVVTERESGRILALNDSGSAFLNGLVIGDDTTTHRVYEDPHARAALLDRMEQDGRVESFETRLRRPCGDVRDVLIAASPITIERKQAVLAAVVDITDRKVTEERVREAANHDVLTGLPNRALFQERLCQILAEAERDGSEAALLLIDLDGLKEVNDTFGHDAGDALLIEAARRLRATAATRDEDGVANVVARLGGDEFAIVLGRAGRLEAEAFAQDLVETMRLVVPFRSQTLTSRASIGVALSPEHDRAPGELVKDADLALYAAKQGGRDRVMLYEPALRTGFEGRIQILREATAALDARLIEPHYQPKVRLDTGALIGFEALARWRHPERGLITPATFGAAFEDPKLAEAIGERMAASIAGDLRRWLDAGLPCGRVALNLAPAEFLRGDVVRRLLAALDHAGVPADRLDIEVTESVFLGTGADAVGTALDALSAAGMRIALDDFGTGFASLTHLKRFPVDEIKIDRSFVRAVDTDPDDAAIVSAVIDLAEALEIAVTAEGVETQAQAAFLAARGCAQAQGWLFGRPMPAGAVAPFLAERARDAA